MNAKTTKNTVAAAKTKASKVKAKAAELDMAKDDIQVAEPQVAEPVAPSIMSTLVTQLVEAKPSEPSAKPKTEKNEGVGLFIRKLINEGLGNKEILGIVHEQYGNTSTTYACVAWYRNKMKKDGAVVKKTSNLEWLQGFAKANGLSEQAVAELSLKVA